MHMHMHTHMHVHVHMHMRMHMHMHVHKHRHRPTNLGHRSFWCFFAWRWTVGYEVLHWTSYSASCTSAHKPCICTH